MSGNFNLTNWKLPSFLFYNEIIIIGDFLEILHAFFIAFHQLLNLMGQCGKPMERYHLDQCFF
jgi:hypothetical protein